MYHEQCILKAWEWLDRYCGLSVSCEVGGRASENSASGVYLVRDAYECLPVASFKQGRGCLEY